MWSGVLKVFRWLLGSLVDQVVCFRGKWIVGQVRRLFVQFIRHALNQGQQVRRGRYQLRVGIGCAFRGVPLYSGYRYGTAVYGIAAFRVRDGGRYRGGYYEGFPRIRATGL